MKLSIRANRERCFEGINIYIFEKDKDKTYLGKLSFDEIKDQGGIPEPAISLSTSHFDTTAQVLMDDLWECGIRPSEGQGSAGQLSAVQNHLDDMRKISFNRLNIEK